jgi:hypothetical protein
MHIVLVDWKIISGQEEDFLRAWRAEMTVNDRARMVGEFLSKVVPRSEEFPWITWDDLIDVTFTRFINVALWADAESFHDQIGRYFNPAGGKQPYEYELRRRALLSPGCWRMGDWRLPVHDSGGVL